MIEKPSVSPIVPVSPWAVGALFFTGLIGVYVVPVQVGALIDGLHFSASRSGVLGTTEIASMSIASIAVAAVVARFSLARLALIGVGLAAVAELLTVILSNFTGLIFIRAAVGIGCGLTFGATTAAIARCALPDRVMGYGQAFSSVIFSCSS